MSGCMSRYRIATHKYKKKIGAAGSSPRGFVAGVGAVAHRYMKSTIAYHPLTCGLFSTS